MEKEFVTLTRYKVSTSYLFSKATLLKYYGYVIENTKRCTSIVNFRYKLDTIDLYKRIGIFRIKKVKTLPIYSCVNLKTEVNSTNLRRNGTKLKQLKNAIKDCDDEIKKHLRNKWKIKE